MSPGILIWYLKQQKCVDIFPLPDLQPFISTLNTEHLTQLLSLYTGRNCLPADSVFSLFT